MTQNLYTVPVKRAPFQAPGVCHCLKRKHPRNSGECLREGTVNVRLNRGKSGRTTRLPGPDDGLMRKHCLGGILKPGR